MKPPPPPQSPSQRRIAKSVRALLTEPDFESWKAQQAWSPGDLCVVNSSFVLRDGVSTAQARERLVLTCDTANTLALTGVANVEKMTSTFKRYAAKSLNLPNITPIADALRAHEAAHGDLMFALVGDVGDAPVARVDGINTGPVSSLLLDTTLSEVADVRGSEVRVRSTESEEAIWAAIRHHFSVAEAGKVRNAIASKLDALDDLATIPVTIPGRGQVPVDPLLRRLASSLQRQVQDYRAQLAAWQTTAERHAMHELLRISYCFASDGMRLLRLVLSICDLKPAVFWCTVHKHFRVERAFAELPWQSREKASLKLYVEMINTARNHAFHDAFGVGGALAITMPGGVNVEDFTIHMLARHGSKNNTNRIAFRDQEVVDLLTAFTRASWRTAPTGFWEKNADAMDAVVELLFDVSDALLELR